MEKLTYKDKHKGKVGNHLYTNMIPKPTIVRKAQMQDIGNAFEIKGPEIKTIFLYRLIQHLFFNSGNYRSKMA